MPAKQKTLAARLRTLRLSADLSQTELAAAASLPLWIITMIEQGRTLAPKWDTMCALADALGVSLDEMRA